MNGITKIKINRTQYFTLIPNLLFGKAIGITAGVVARRIGSDTWLSMLIGFGIGIISIMVMVYLCSKFPDKNIIEFSEIILGKFFGKFIGIIFFLFFLIAFAVSANVMTLHIKEYFLVQTPMLVICIIYTLLCTYGVYLGIEVAIRFSLIGLLMCISITFVMITGTIGDFKYNNLLPLFDKGILNNIEIGFYMFSDIAMAVLSIGFIYPMLNSKKKVFQVSFWSSVLGLILIIPWPLFETGVMSAEAMENIVVVCMQQIRCAQLTTYLPRYELVMVSFFAFTVFVQAVIMFYFAVSTLEQVFGIKKRGFIIVPLSIVLIALTFFMSYDHNNYVHFLSFPWSQICAVLSIATPLIILAVALVRGKLRKTGNTNKQKAT